MKEKTPYRFMGLRISAAVIAVILIGSTIWFEGVKSSYLQDIKEIKKTYLFLSKNAAAIDHTKRQRVDYFKKRFFAEIPLRYSYGTSNFVRRLSLINAEGIELEKLEMKPRGQDFSFVLNGRVIADNNFRVHARFLRFYQNLKTFDDMVQITYSTRKADSKGTEKTAAARDLKRPVNTRGKNWNRAVLFFTISGGIELE
jgi:hypothetical protein